MKYKKTFRDSILRKVLPPENRSVSSVSKEMGVAVVTINSWLAKLKNDTLSLEEDGGSGCRNANEKLNFLLEYQKVTAENEGEWLRHNGLHSEHLTLFKQELSEILSSSIDTMNLQERITYYNSQKDKWNKIFLQLETYMNENVAYVVYDFSYLEDKVDMVMENVHFSVEPGIKCVPNAVAMKVFSAVYNEWQEIISDKNNAVWTRSVTQPHLGHTGEYFEFYYDFTITVGLFDNDGNLLVQNKISPQGIRGIRRLFGIVDSNLIVKSAEEYFGRAEYNQIIFSPLKIDKIANGVNIKIINAKMSIFDRNNRKGSYDGYKQPPIISHDEWNALSN